MIKAIIFDFGGVILQHRADIMPYILRQLFPDNLEIAMRVWHDYKVALNKGNISSKEVLSILKKETNSTIDIEELQKKWKNIYAEEAKDVNEKLMELINKLKKNYKVYLFTDTIAVHDEVNKTKGIYERFDGVYKSFDIRMAKLEGAEAFKYVSKQITIIPKECVMIDDVESNITLAEKIGMKGILYKNYEQLLLDLKHLGIRY